MSTRKILEKTLTDAQAVLDKATADLAALDKPELRHGDIYRSHGQKDGLPRIVIGNGKKAKTYDRNGNIIPQPFNDGFYDESSPEFNAFDVFDDLKAIQEPLSEFEVGDKSRTLEFQACKNSNSDVIVRLKDYDGSLVGNVIVNISNLVEPIRRMEATLKNKETG